MVSVNFHTFWPFHGHWWKIDPHCPNSIPAFVVAGVLIYCCVDWGGRFRDEVRVLQKGYVLLGWFEPYKSFWRWIMPYVSLPTLPHARKWKVKDKVKVSLFCLGPFAGCASLWKTFAWRTQQQASFVDHLHPGIRIQRERNSCYFYTFDSNTLFTYFCYYTIGRGNFFFGIPPALGFDITFSLAVINILGTLACPRVDNI